MRPILLVALLLATVACRQNEIRDAGGEGIAQTLTPARQSVPAFDTLLADAGVEGSILIFDAAAGTFFSNDFTRAETKFIPASTFKIANSIVGLEVGTLDADTTVFRWDHAPRFIEAWEQDLQLADAFRLSCVPCYRELARRTGVNRMRAELDEIGYPGIVFDSSTIDNFWLTGESAISQFEQIEFLRRLNEEELPIQTSTTRILKDIMVLDTTGAATLRGKTGWAIDDDFDLGWFVGYLVEGDNVCYFATNVEPVDRADMAGFAEARVVVTREALELMSQ